MCVFVFYGGRLVNRVFVVLSGNDEIITMHFEEWWGRNDGSQEGRNGGG